jgi:WD40 repeat protein
MILWDVVTAKQLVTFEHPRVVICCAFTPDAKLLVSGCQDKVCRVWDTKRGKECMNFARHEAIVVSLSVVPNEEQCKGGLYPVCSGSADKTVRIWNAAGPGSVVNNNAHVILHGHTGIVLCCQYSPNGQYIVSSDEKLAKVWSVADTTCVCTFSVDNIILKTTLVNKMPKRLTWTLVQFCPHQFGLCIAAVSNTRTIHILDVEKEKESEPSELLQLYARSPVHCLSAGKERTLVYGDSFGNVYVTMLK